MPLFIIVMAKCPAMTKPHEACDTCYFSSGRVTTGRFLRPYFTPTVVDHDIVVVAGSVVLYVDVGEVEPDPVAVLRPHGPHTVHVVIVLVGVAGGGEALRLRHGHQLTSTPRH